MPTFRGCPAAGLWLWLVMAAVVPAQANPGAPLVEDVFADAMRYRCIGPFRGGRSAAVAGVPGQPMQYYFGGAGGGVWKTEDGGATWGNVSDGYFGGSIGAVAISEADPNVIYVGGGEKTVRGNVSHGNGVWKSLDAGQTWQHVGLEDTRRIPRIRIHPKDPNLVYVAALGHLFGPNEQRGVFRSRDGGKTWERILFVNAHAGAVDLLLDPNNPRVIYASTWRIRRTPYSLESGGDGSGLWKSTDAGDTWTEITRSPGLPKGTVGIIGVTVSPVDSRRVWAIIESREGGVFRSDDAGATWKRVNAERNLRQRAWYYTRIYAGPKNVDEVYVLNVGFWRSGDGGATYQRIGTPHGDHHDLWIAEDDPRRMVIGDDGGAQVTFNGGRTWSDYQTQPTAQFYRVTTDNHFPYRIYGAQQDNSTVRILHRSSSRTIGERDWEPTAGGESGHIAPNPTDPEIVYGGSYGGLLTRVNHRTGEVRAINVWPDNPMGHGAEDLKYRFQWNFPIFFSPHDPKTLYTAGNVLFKTTNEGQNWLQISPDLTRNQKSKLGASGGPITKDNTGVEYYCTIFAALESPHEKGVLWAGSDDGLIHVSRDGGKTWNNVTPPDLPEWTQINSIEAHPKEKGGLYVAGTRYKLDDFEPYLYKTLDYGKTWRRIDRGIDRKHFTRVVRADPARPGLLYAGTESGLYVSLDDGGLWAPLQLNLPIVPITDLAIKNNDLIVATQGRSFWVLDDLTPLHQWKPEFLKSELHAFTPRATLRLRGGATASLPRTAGQNPPSGVVFRYYLRDAPEDRITLTISSKSGAVVRRFSNKPKKGEGKLPAEAGLNRFEWDMRYPEAESFPGMVMWAAAMAGPRAVPGEYRAHFETGTTEQTVDFVIEADPRAKASPQDYQAQLQFLLQVRDTVSRAHRAIKRIRDVRTQLEAVAKRFKDRDDAKEVVKEAGRLSQLLTEIEEALYQTQNQSPQDPLNFPIRLNNRLASLASVASVGDNRPTGQSLAVRQMLSTLIAAQVGRLQQLLDNDVKKFNGLVQEKQLPAVVVKPDEP